MIWLYIYIAQRIVSELYTHTASCLMRQHRGHFCLLSLSFSSSLSCLPCRCASYAIFSAADISPLHFIALSCHATAPPVRCQLEIGRAFSSPELRSAAMLPRRLCAVQIISRYDIIQKRSQITPPYAATRYEPSLHSLHSISGY